MDNFNLKKYLAEGKLLKEEMNVELQDYVSDMYNSDVEEKEGFQSDVWSKAEYASNAYTEESVKLFLKLINHLKSVGGKDVVEGNPDIKLELLPNEDIKWSANVTFMENFKLKKYLAEGKLLKENFKNVVGDIENLSEDSIKTKTSEFIEDNFNPGEEEDNITYEIPTDEVDDDILDYIKKNNRLNVQVKGQGSSLTLQGNNVVIEFF